MKLRGSTIHPLGEAQNTQLSPLNTQKDQPQIEIDTFDGKVHVEWDSDAELTPYGQLPFFIQFLKVGHRFDP